MTGLFKIDSNQPIVVRAWTAATVVIAGQEIESFVGTLGDITQAAELPSEVAFESQDFTWIVGIEDNAIKSLAAQPGE